MTSPTAHGASRSWRERGLGGTAGPGGPLPLGRRGGAPGVARRADQDLAGLDRVLRLVSPGSPTAFRLSGQLPLPAVPGWLRGTGF
jgi:hypothetical protein